MEDGRAVSITRCASFFETMLMGLLDVFDSPLVDHFRLCSTLRDSQPRILKHVILIDGRSFTVYLPELFITNGRNSYVCAIGEVLLRPRQRASNP